MRLLFAVNNFAIGGVQKALINLICSLPSDEYSIDLVALYPQGPFVEEIPPDVKLLTAGSLLSCLSMSNRQALTKPVTRWPIRTALALLARYISSSAAIDLAILSQPRLLGPYDAAIAYMHGARPHQLGGGVWELVLDRVHANSKIGFVHADPRTSAILSPHNRRQLARFDRVATVSRSAAHALSTLAPEIAPKVTPVRNTILPAQLEHLASESLIGFDRSVVNIVSVSRLASEKRIDKLLKAAKTVTSHGLRLRFHILGDGILRTELQALRDSLGLEGIVRFYGEVRNPYPYIRAADALLLTSESEAAPLVIDEALALNTPVISTRTLSAHEMVGPYGIVCGHDDQSIAAALVSFAANAERATNLSSALRQRNGILNQATSTDFVTLLHEPTS